MLHKQLRYGYLASYIRKIREMKRREKTKYIGRKKRKNGMECISATGYY